MVSTRSNLSALFLGLCLLAGSVSATETSTASTTAAATTSTTAASTTTTSKASTTTSTVKPTLTTPAVPTKSVPEVPDEVCYESVESDSTYKPHFPTTFSKVPGGGSVPQPTDSAPKPTGTLITSGAGTVIPGLALGLLAAVAVL